MDTLNCMKALISLLGVILAMAFMASPAHAQSHENDRYQKLADDLKTPGLAVVTFDATGVTDEHYVGVDSNSNPIGPDSLFIWGSISKSFTSALAMMLAEQGKIDLNAPLTRSIPNSKEQHWAIMVPPSLTSYTTRQDCPENSIPIPTTCKVSLTG